MHLHTRWSFALVLAAIGAAATAHAMRGAPNDFSSAFPIRPSVLMPPPFPSTMPPPFPSTMPPPFPAVMPPPFPAVMPPPFPAVMPPPFPAVMPPPFPAVMPPPSPAIMPPPLPAILPTRLPGFVFLPRLPPPPAISVVIPAGASVNRIVPISAALVAPAPVTGVEFLVDDIAIANAIVPPFAVSFDTAAFADGRHTLIVRITDANRGIVTSTPMVFTVRNKPIIDVNLSAAEVFPDTVSRATGTGRLEFDLVTGVVSGGVTLTGIAATQVLVHRGFAGENGPAVLPLVRNAMDPNRWDVQPGAVLTPEQVNDLLAGRLHVIAHSAAFPAGEIRAQIRPNDLQIVVTRMSGAEIAPPLLTPATGLAGVTIDPANKVATVHLSSLGAEDALEAHVHAAPLGTSAPLALFPLIKDPDPAAPGHWFIEGQPITPADLDAFVSNLWYVDMHTPAAPGGLLRGQFVLPPPVFTPTLTQLQETVFTPLCSSCHFGGGFFLPTSLDLSNAQATFMALVGVMSTQMAPFLRVAPGDPDSSFLVHKIEGRPGIAGLQMPPAGPSLDPAMIAAIRAWIAAGAPNN